MLGVAKETVEPLIELESTEFVKIAVLTPRESKVGLESIALCPPVASWRTTKVLFSQVVVSNCHPTIVFTASVNFCVTSKIVLLICRSSIIVWLPQRRTKSHKILKFQLIKKY